MIRETAAVFGSDSSLIGVISDPAPEQASAGKPTILFLNAGLIHRVGPARLYVRLARAMAARGYLTLRFDMPGRGDSDGGRGPDSVAFGSGAEVQQAMDYLGAKRGSTRFVLIGICSGAANAVQAAEHEDRVVGAVLINAHAYQTFQSRARYYLSRVGKSSSWKNALAGRSPLGRKLRNAVSRPKVAEDEMLAARDDDAAPTREAAASLLRRIIGKGVKLFLIFSSGPGYNYRQQFADAFSDVDFAGRINVAYIPEADHTFTRLANQERLEREILAWTDGVSSGGVGVMAGAAAETGTGTVGRPAVAVASGAAVRGEPDPSGRDRVAWNVAWSWLGYLVFLISGFVLPRLIDTHLGQDRLGTWDLCWSLVNYFKLAQIGVGASVNRHVALHRAAGDIAGLNRTASSVMAVQLIATLLMIVFTAGTVAVLPSTFGPRLGEWLGEAQWVIALLGTSLVVQMAFHVYNGVLTGCHRWDLHNLIDGGSQALGVVGIVISLSLGHGLVWMAFMAMLGATVGEVTRAVVVHRICPELELRPRYVDRRESWQLIIFGSKISIVGLATLALAQTNSLAVAGHLGIAQLAIYARPVALLRHLTAISRKYSLVLVPTVSSLQSLGKHGELRELVIESTRFAAFLNFPILVAFAVLGESLLQLWMGRAYVDAAGALTILAVGSVVPLSTQPIGTILVGLDRHAIVAKTAVASSALGIAMSLFTIDKLGWGIHGAAASIAVAGTLGSLALPFEIRRALGLPVNEFLRRSYVAPVLVMIPFAAVFVACRYFVHGSAGKTLVAATVGAVVLMPLYWAYAVPPRWRVRLKARVARLLGTGKGPLDAQPPVR